MYDLCITSTNPPPSFNSPSPISPPSHEFVFENDESNNMDKRETETTNSFVDERTFRCIEELVLKRCFLRKRFDSLAFVELMNSLSHLNVVKQVFSKKTPFLQALISSVMKKVFVSLSMTRSQIDTFSRQFKCILLILSDDNTMFAEQIHSNYNSCLRDAWANVQERDMFIEDYF